MVGIILLVIWIAFGVINEISLVMDQRVRKVYFRRFGWHLLIFLSGPIGSLLLYLGYLLYHSMSDYCTIQGFDDRPYFHELRQDEIDKLKNEHRTIEYIKQHYRQPAWCGHPDALNGDLGCWSLMDLDGDRKRISREYCEECEMYKSEE